MCHLSVLLVRPWSLLSYSCHKGVSRDPGLPVEIAIDGYVLGLWKHSFRTS